MAQRNVNLALVLVSVIMVLVAGTQSVPLGSSAANADSEAGDVSAVEQLIQAKLRGGASAKGPIVSQYDITDTAPAAWAWIADCKRGLREACTPGTQDPTECCYYDGQASYCGATTPGDPLDPSAPHICLPSIMPSTVRSNTGGVSGYCTYSWQCRNSRYAARDVLSGPAYQAQCLSASGLCTSV